MPSNINRGAMLPTGTVLRGSYRIDGYLSSGGFGNTYVATHLQFNERCAIKEFFMKGVNERLADNTSVRVSNSDNVVEFDEQKAKFMKEAKRLHNLHNAHIVRVNDLFDENGTSYYVMDYIDGESLKERLERTSEPMKENEVLDVLHQVLDALREVHNQGLWHLDLKPANVMMDRKGVVKLIDFGASKQFDQSKGGAMSTSAVTYTSGYAPIEQMDSHYEKFGPWTDFYALGATLYNLLTNKKPPTASDIADDFTPDKSQALPMPSSLSQRTRELVLWLMTPNRMKRPQSVQDIYGFLGGQSISSTDGQTQKDEETVIARTDRNVTDNADNKIKTFESNNAINTNDTPESKSEIKLNRILIIAGCAAMLLIGWLLYALTANHNPSLNDSPAESGANETEAVTTQPYTNMQEQDQNQQSGVDALLQQVIDNMVYVEGGSFTMGATPEQGSDAFKVEKPAHKVSLSDYYINKYEVTQELWEAVMGTTIAEQCEKANNRQRLKGKKPDEHVRPNLTGEGPNYPMYYISWDECHEFIKKLNSLTGKHFRMPTEAEWEYAARGGNRSLGYKYSGSDIIDDVAWYKENYGSEVHPVGNKSSNELGLYDMSGNVCEWCEDRYAHYSSASQNNPTGPATGPNRLIRGGSWCTEARYSRVSNRNYAEPSYSNCVVGLRLAF